MMKSSLIRINLIFILLFLFIPNLVSAETKIFIKEYTYQASEADSKLSSRTIALEQVKRLLLEELGTYIESHTEVTNFNLTKDQITALTAGIVQTQIMKEKWDGERYWVRAQIEADPSEVVKAVDSLRKDRQRSEELEEANKRAESALREVDKLREELKLAKVEEKEQKKTEYNNAINELSASFADFKKKIEERRQKESKWVRDFEDAKQLEKNDTLGINERIEIWQHLITTLPDERTAKGEEIWKYATNRLQRLEQFRAMGKTEPKEIKNDGRFIAYDDGTVLDTQTGLMWAAQDNGYEINWYGAKKYCESYRGGGYTDWRMPTLDEMTALYDFGNSYKATQRDYNVHLTGLIKLSSCCPWASNVHGSQNATFFHFDSGTRYQAPWSISILNRALPVRSGELVDTP